MEEESLNLEPLLINTVLGSYSLDLPVFENISFFLNHEHIFQDLSRFHEGTSQSAVSLQDYSLLLEDPSKISSNLVLNDYDEMLHEIGLLSKEYKIAIVEGTRSVNKKDILKLQALSQGLGIPIVTGFEIFIDKKTLFSDKQMNEVFINKEAFLKRLSLEFSLGGPGPNKPGFIGPISILEINDDIEKLKIEAYIEFISKSNEKIPLFIECSEILQKDDFAGFDEIFKNLDIFSHKLGKNLMSQTILINIPLVWDIEKDKNSKFDLKVRLRAEEKIIKLLEMGFIFSFNLKKYEKNQKFFIHFLESLLEMKRENQIILSLGNCFKQNLKKYGGKGFREIIDFKSKISTNEENMKKIFWKNLFNLLNWKKIEETKPVTIKKWTCPYCEKEFDENIEKFKKFDKEFCSIKCLRDCFSKMN